VFETGRAEVVAVAKDPAGYLGGGFPEAGGTMYQTGCSLVKDSRN